MPCCNTIFHILVSWDIIHIIWSDKMPYNNFLSNYFQFLYTLSKYIWYMYIVNLILYIKWIKICRLQQEWSHHNFIRYITRLNWFICVWHLSGGDVSYYVLNLEKEPFTFECYFVHLLIIFLLHFIIMDARKSRYG